MPTIFFVGRGSQHGFPFTAVRLLVFGFDRTFKRSACCICAVDWPCKDAVSHTVNSFRRLPYEERLHRLVLHSLGATSMETS